MPDGTTGTDSPHDRPTGPPSPVPDTRSGDGTRHTVVAPVGPLALATVSGPPGFVLLAEVGRGGMGVVYRARDTALNRDVAVKILQDRYPADGPSAARFVEEAGITAQLQHPSIAPVHHVGTLPDGRPFLVMKLIKGDTLDALLAGRLEPSHDRPRFLAVFEQVCLAVGYAHSLGVVHRDLKPANVMVGKFGEVQVMDWGLAKVSGAAPSGEATATAVQSVRGPGTETVAGSVLGTPAYMPPEQAGGEVDRIGVRADVFALGGVLCTILTGRPPYTGADTHEVLLKAVRGQTAEALARLDASPAEPELVALCHRCLSAGPADRPSDANEVARAVAEFRAAAEERARRAESARAVADARAEEQRKRRRVQLALAASLLVALVGAGVVAWRWQVGRATEEAARTHQQSLRERDLAAAVAELGALCDRGDAEINDPARWRLTLRAARSSHGRARAAVDAGVVSDESRRAFESTAARLERDEEDCALAEEIELAFVALFQVTDSTNGPKFLQFAELAGRAFVRAGLSPPIFDRPRDDTARTVRTHRLRYPLSLLFLVLANLRDPAQGDTRKVAEAVTAPTDPFLIQLDAALAGGGGARNGVKDLLQSSAARTANPTDMVIVACRHTGSGYGRDVMDEALRRNPGDTLAHLFRAAAFSGSRDTFIPVHEFDRNWGEDELRGIGSHAASLALRPRLPTLWSEFGKRLSVHKHFRWAADCHRTAIELDPGRTEDRYDLARCLRDDRQYAAALVAFQGAIGLDPLDGPAPSREGRLEAAALALETGYPEVPNRAPEVRARLRGDAWRWLRECVRLWEPGTAQLDRFLDEPKFVAIRHQIAAEPLSEEERRDWRMLWTDIRRLSNVAGTSHFIFLGQSPPPLPVGRTFGLPMAPAPREVTQR